MKSTDQNIFSAAEEEKAEWDSIAVSVFVFVGWAWQILNLRRADNATHSAMQSEERNLANTECKKSHSLPCSTNHADADADADYGEDAEHREKCRRNGIHLIESNIKLEQLQKSKGFQKLQEMYALVSH